MSGIEAVRTCHWCGDEVAAYTACARCLADFPQRPKAETMSPDEREAEMDSLQWCEVPFEMVYERMNQLVGRPVWTHEFGLNWEGLCREARWEDRPATMQEIVGLILPEKRIIFSP